MAAENINFLVGLPLNVCVFFLLTRAGGPGGSLIFTQNQIVCEILFSTPAPLLLLCHINSQNLCFYYPVAFIIAMCLTSRFLLQWCVCLERYLAVLHPLTFLRFKALRYRLALVVAVWTYAFTAGVVTMLSDSDLPLYVFGMLYFVVVSVVLFFTLSLLRGLRRPGPGARERDDGGLSAARKKAFRVVSLNLLIFLIQTIPISVCFGLNMSQNAFVWAIMLSLNISIILSLLQPVLFLYQNGKLPCTRRG